MAIHMANSVYSHLEIVSVNYKQISCNGIKDEKKAYKSSGHPLVYLNMGDKNFVTCPYCNKYYTLQKNIKTSSKK